MVADARLAALRVERAQLTDTINAAYWRFTRCARAKPPSLVVPEAYARRAEVDREIARLHRQKAEGPGGESRAFGEEHAHRRVGSRSVQARVTMAHVRGAPQGDVDAAAPQTHPSPSEGLPR